MAMLERVKVFFEDSKEQLESTKHFGVLNATVASNAGPSRAEYARKHCKLLFDLKQAVPGLGLGRKYNFPPKPASAGGGESRYDWKHVSDWSGLEICQAWAILLNSGHLFGTFATERGLLFQLDRDLGYRDEFSDRALEFDKSLGNTLRSKFEDEIDKARLLGFHYLLAFWRLREGGVSKLEGTSRETARLLLKGFLLTPTDSLKRLVEIFRQTRQLVYLTMHNQLEGSKYKIGDAGESDLRALFPLGAIPGSDVSSRDRWEVLASINRHDTNHFFGSASAAGEILPHVESFKDWWRKREKESVDFASRIDALFHEPEDWPHKGIVAYKPFTDLWTPSRLTWLSEVRLWLRDSGGSDPWEGANFLVTPNPQSSPLRVDLYTADQGLATRTLRHVVSQLARSFSDTRSDSTNHTLWMSAARLMARAFKACLKPGYAILLQPSHASDGQVGYSSVGDTYEFVRGVAQSFLPSCRDDLRKAEIRQALKVADQLVHRRSPAMLMLASAKIVNEDDRGDEVTDIDGLIGYFRDDELFWIVVETKERNSQNGAKQLRENLGRALIEDVGEVKVVACRDYESWFVKIKSPRWIL